MTKELKKSNIRVMIGIDPDIDKSGFAIIHKEPFRGPTVAQVETLSFWELINWFETRRNEGLLPTLVCLEAGWLNKVSNYHGANNKAIAGRIGKNVGENHAVGKLIEGYLKVNNIPYKLIKPVSSKWDGELFKKITGWQGRTNSEMRDAVRAAWV